MDRYTTGYIWIDTPQDRTIWINTPQDYMDIHHRTIWIHHRTIWIDTPQDYMDKYTTGLYTPQDGNTPQDYMDRYTTGLYG